MLQVLMPLIKEYIKLSRGLRPHICSTVYINRSQYKEMFNAKKSEKPCFLFLFKFKRIYTYTYTYITYTFVTYTYISRIPIYRVYLYITTYTVIPINHGYLHTTYTYILRIPIYHAYLYTTYTYTSRIPIYPDYPCPISHATLRAWFNITKLLANLLTKPSVFLLLCQLYIL